MISCFRHGNTYRNMSDLHQDEKYGEMWKSSSSLAEPSEANALLTPNLDEPIDITTSGDSGRFSSSPHTHHRSQSDPQAVFEEGSSYPTSSPKRGFISSYLEDHKRRRSQIASCSATPTALDNGFLVEAPAEFRSQNNSRPTSIADSTHSNYAASNTSDYGSNTASSETNYSTRTKSRQFAGLSQRDDNSNTGQAATHNVIIINSNYPSRKDSISSLTESAKKKPFTTFHGDIV